LLIFNYSLLEVQLFYQSNIAGEYITLGEEESKHCIRVLRLQNGDSVNVTDGRGSLFKTVIENENPKKCELKIVSQQKETPPPFELIIAVAPTKNMARMEWLMEKLTEIGITKFIPVECHNSERVVLKTERLKRIALEAMKQSNRLYLPEVNELISFDELLKEYKDVEGQKIIPHCGAGERKFFASAYKKGENALIIIGPEGDFTWDEVNLATENGFIPVTLSSKTLRTETAALVAAAVVNSVK
jgi:16S rRNA (uracil1498-N3)-methyltransferase